MTSVSEYSIREGVSQEEEQHHCIQTDSLDRYKICMKLESAIPDSKPMSNRYRFHIEKHRHPISGLTIYIRYRFDIGVDIESTSVTRSWEHDVELISISLYRKCDINRISFRYCLFEAKPCATRLDDVGYYIGN